MTEVLYPEIKIIDFGLARKIKPGEQICLIVGTPEYVGKYKDSLPFPSLDSLYQ